MDAATSPCNPCGSPATAEVRAPSPPPSPQAGQAQTPPPRATLILPDAMALRPPSSGTSSDHQAGISRGAAQTLPTPAASLGHGDPKKGTRSAVSSPRSEIGRHCGAARNLKKQPELTPGPVTSHSSRMGTRTPRVLKTSRDFRETIRRVYKVGANVLVHIFSMQTGLSVVVHTLHTSTQPCQKLFFFSEQHSMLMPLPACRYSRNIPGRIGKVELSEEEARSLYRRLDTDRDGALGAEDLLRGAPTVGGVRRSTKYR